MALEMWVVSSGGMITMGLNAVATIMQNDGWKTLVWIAELLGVIFCILTWLKSHDLKVMFFWGLTFVLVTTLMLTPKTTVVVNDLTAPQTIGRVDNVPMGLAIPLYLVTGTGYTLATLYEDVFHFPDERAYTKTGMLFASKLMQDSFTIESRDPVLSYNLVEYTKQCVVPDIMLNQKYSYQDVMESTDVQSVIFSKPSPLRGIMWRDVSGTSFMYCRDAAPRLKNLLNAQSNATGRTFLSHAARMLPGSTAPQTIYADQLAGTYDYFFDSSKTAQSIMLQNIAVAGLRRGMNSYVKGMNDTASMVDIASESSLMKLRLSHAVSYTIATEVLPQLHTVLMLFCVCIFPLMILALFIRELAWSVIKSYLNFMGSLMLWPVMFAIFNFAVNFSTQNSYHSTGPTLSNVSRLMETSSTTAGIAGWLMLSIPFLAFRLFTGLGQGFASLSSSLGSALSSASAGDSAAVASGNHSVGNVQLDNVNGFKTNLNREYRQGLHTEQLANGALETGTAVGGTVYDSTGAMSRLPVDLHLDRHLASAAQKMTRDSMSQTEAAQQGYNHSVQRNASQLRQFHDQYGNSDTVTLSASTGMSVNDSERVSRMQSVAQDYASRNNVSLTQAYSELEDKSRNMSGNAGARGSVNFNSGDAIWGKAGTFLGGVSVKGDIHGGVEVTGKTGSTSQVSEGGQSGKDNSHTLSAREAQDFSQGMDVLRNYNMSYNGQHVDNNAAGLMNQLSTGINTSDSQYRQYSVSQSHTHELQQMASETDTLSAGARENYNQQFVEWVQKNAPDDAREVLTNTSDENVQQQREALVEQFVQEKLQGRIQGDYAQNAGRTGEGMHAPANTAQPGSDWDDANAKIDGRIVGNNININVKGNVDEISDTVKGREDYARFEMENGRGNTHAGMNDRKDDFEQGNESFSSNKKHADKENKKWIPKEVRSIIGDNEKAKDFLDNQSEKN